MPSPLVEVGIEQQACLGLYRFHEAVTLLSQTSQGLIAQCPTPPHFLYLSLGLNHDLWLDHSVHNLGVIL